MAAVTRQALWGGIQVPYPFEQSEGPTPFLFPAVQGVALSAADVTSNTVVMAGISTARDVTLSGDASAEYSKNGGAWSTAPTTALNGDTFAVRVDASASYNTPVAAILTVGEVVVSFIVTTLRDTTLGGNIAPITRLHGRR